jgi:hypothetical protein
VLEASGIATVTLSMIPGLTRAADVPRLAGISYPFGRPLGRPYDADGQRAVLRATRDLLPGGSGPDTLPGAVVRVARIASPRAKRLQRSAATTDR